MEGSVSDQRALVDVRVLLLDSPAVLMIQRADALFPGYWNLPGGHVHAGEDALTAAVRELREEVGVLAARSDLRFVGVSHYRPPTRSEKISFTFAARQWAGEPKIVEHDRFSAASWFSSAQPPSLIMPQAAEAIRLFRSGDQFSIYGLG